MVTGRLNQLARGQAAQLRFSSWPTIPYTRKPPVFSTQLWQREVDVYSTWSRFRVMKLGDPSSRVGDTNQAIDSKPTKVTTGADSQKVSMSTTMPTILGLI